MSADKSRHLSRNDQLECDDFATALSLWRDSYDGRKFTKALADNYPPSKSDG